MYRQKLVPVLHSYKQEFKMADSRSKIEIKLDAISNVDIDDKGRFKYILIKVHDPSDDSIGKCIVRGFKRADYHGEFTVVLYIGQIDISYR